MSEGVIEMRQLEKRLSRRSVTAVIFVLLGLTIWGGWPEQVVDGHEQLGARRLHHARLGSPAARNRNGG